MIVKSSVKGTLVGESVIISENGSVHADTEVVSMTVGGNFQGKIRASDELIILSTGTCMGEVACKELVVKPGGILNAELSSIELHGSRQVAYEKLKKTS